uniref:Uncharacterized protein n=2 Tax=Salix viminalis TaxID=40686 RepID=A0A6N2KAH2_SALVM
MRLRRILAPQISSIFWIQILKASQANLKEFISFCEAMELVPEEELQGSSQGAPNTFVDRRALKIARYKRQRAAEAKLDEIKERKERRSGSTKASAVSTPVGRKTCWMMMEKKSERKGRKLFPRLFLMNMPRKLKIGIVMLQ